MLWIKNFLKTGFGTFCLVFVPALFFCFFLGTNNTYADNSQYYGNILVEYTETSTSLTFSSVDDFFNYPPGGSTIQLCGYFSYDYPNILFNPPQCSSFDLVTFNDSLVVPYLKDSVTSEYIDGYSNIPFALFLPSYDTTLTIQGFNGDMWSVSTFPYTVTFNFIDLDSGSSECPVCPSLPSGTLNISENGTYDVSTYAQAVVDIPPETVYGDYHDDLLSIKHSIYVCGAIVLVLYFFYCIYRMIIKSTGGF